MSATRGGINFAGHVSFHVKLWYNMTVVFYEHCNYICVHYHNLMVIGRSVMV
jgi:hypothetical protein